jgi:glycopeptide antibiotics resistance protein
MIFLTYDIQLLLLVTSLGWIIARLVRFAIQKRGSLLRELTLTTLFLFLWFLIQRTLEPFVLVLDQTPEPPNLVPLQGLVLMLQRAIAIDHAFTRWIVAVNILGNILIFVPIGFLVSVLTPNHHKGWLTLVIGLAISLTIEIVQLSFVIRVFDVDDLILNSFGAWLGFITFLLASKINPLKELFEHISSAQRPRAWVFVLLYGAFAVASAAVIFWIDYTAYLRIPQ